MVSQAALGLSAQRVRVLVVAAVVLGGFVAQETSARFIDHECVGAMGNRDIYEKVVWVCDDCANIFRNNNVGESCKKNCFYNMDFQWCVYATERHGDMEHFKRWVSILSAGRK
ncbi:gonad-inhibiting hormone-like [Panulirus ornatus]|uniref:gonad-inhibiting hormone-like n=1 Tax=Panulirus ornatus TaxID=150431 RepID=UPI003A84623A